MVSRTSVDNPTKSIFYILHILLLQFCVVIAVTDVLFMLCTMCAQHGSGGTKSRFCACPVLEIHRHEADFEFELFLNVDDKS